MSLLAPGWLLLAAAVGAAGLLVSSWRQERLRRGTGWRRAVLVVVALALFLLIAQPAAERSQPRGEAVLVTARADPEWLRSLEPRAERLVLPGGDDQFATPAVDSAHARRLAPGKSRWLIGGVGVDEWQLSALPGEVEFVAPVEPGPGVDRVHWPRRVALGDAVEVQGTVASIADPGAQIRLSGPRGVLAESAVVDGSFRLSFVPRKEGRHLYRLEFESLSTGLIVDEIDVVVGAASPPRVLWVEGAPSFESREVKSWLRDLGGVMAVRSQLSRGRYRFEFLNRERLELARLLPSQLTEFDLLVIDGAAWQGLGRREKEVVSEAVRAGLGLLLAPSLPRLRVANAPPVPFSVSAVGDLETFEVTADVRGTRLEPLAIPARQFTGARGQRALLVDAADRPLAVSAALGAGKVGASLLEETYRWVLRGEAASHRRYWSHLIASLGRPAGEPDIALPPGPHLVDRPLSFSIVVPQVRAVELVAPDGVAQELAPRQSPLVPQRWQATYWPREPGWHEVAWGDASRAFYVAERTSWASWRERQANSATRHRASLGDGGSSTEGSPSTASAAGVAGVAANPPVELPRWPLFLLLLAGWGALWADEQWRGRSIPA